MVIAVIHILFSYCGCPNSVWLFDVIQISSGYCVIQIPFSDCVDPNSVSLLRLSLWLLRLYDFRLVIAVIPIRLFFVIQMPCA